MKKTILLFIFLFFSFSFSQSFTDSVLIKGNNKTGPFLISNYEIDSSLLVTKDNDTLNPDLHYRFFPDENTIMLEEPLPDTCILLIRYKRKRNYLPKLFYRRDINSLLTSDATKPDTAIDINSAPEKSTVSGNQFLQVGGVKTFGISAYSGGGLSLDQSLQVQIQGQITQGTSIRASLSDQNIPLQPEGTSRMLSEIEQARIDIESQRFSGTLGDFYDRENLKFIRYSKKIQGVRGKAKTNSWKTSFAGASSRGTFRSYSFSGQDGRQGPYRLKGKNGETNIVVLAGTESVWLDGRKMTRGQNHDYTIDYSTGWIRFTPRRMITSESEITANYEYLEQEYERTLIHGLSEYNNGKLSVRVTGVQENDSRKNPLNFILSDKEKAALEKAGDLENVRTGLLRLINLYEAGEKGFYLKKDSGNVSFYKYYPPDSLEKYKSSVLYGDNFGFKEGSNYDTLNIEDSYGIRTIYYYKGNGQGRFSPGSILPTPNLHRVIDLSVSGNVSDITLKAEFAGSEADKNTFSPIDDFNNTGFAADISAGYGTGNKTGLFIKTGFAENDSTFHAFGTNADNYAYRKKWNLPNSSYIGQSLTRRAEITGGWMLENIPLLQIEAGLLNRNENQSVRAAGEAGIKIFSSGEIHAKDEEIKTSRGQKLARLHRDELTLRMPKKWAGAFSRLKHEWFTRDTLSAYRATGYEDITIGIEPGSIGLFEPNVETSFRRDKISEKQDFFSGIDSVRSTKIKSGITMQPWHGISFRFSAGQHRRTYLLKKDSPVSVYDLADISTRYEPSSGAVVLRNDYSLSSSELNTYRDRFIYVGDGRGTYEKDSVTGDFLPKEGGAYELSGRTADSTGTGREIEFNNWIKLRPVYWKKTGGFLDDLSFSTNLKLFTQRKPLPPTLFTRYLPDWGFTSANSNITVNQHASLIQDIFFQPGHGKLSVSFRLNPAREESFHYGHEIREQMSYRVTMKNTIGKKFSGNIQAKRDKEKRNRISPSGIKTLKYDILNRELDAGTSYRFLRSVTAALNGGAGRSNENIGQAVYDFYFLKPSVTKKISSRGRLRAEYGWHKVYGEGNLYYRMAQGYAKGLTQRWSFSGDYKIGDNLMLNIYYFGRIEEISDKPFHQANMNLRAYF